MFWPVGWSGPRTDFSPKKKKKKKKNSLGSVFTVWEDTRQR